MIKKRDLPAQAGMTLFIAIVIMSILLFISFAVTNIAIKGSLFASSGRDSQYAFYAADSGIECAIYWDSKKYKGLDSNNNPIYGSAFDPAITGSPITCAGVSMTDNSAISGTSTITMIGGGVANRTSTFGFVLNQGSNPVQSCAIVTVEKEPMVKLI